ncbi:pyrroline-5-carboxylate reductase [Frankia sp. CNm7]|uniref:Pyrroline-5-carboxylate reductase n=2 Tax=Frankia nepalensis TaxID=1836974 RepID=A0A937RRL0_9ACTN|nr:pyrroline-5-carboxylate reductase [Frankia nepalensis]MBL7496012.1 pyrroline-5-carboxylate reductase [Frankia nepalensis]MBL7514938.1 pyrroline-5-carboxylate reductase [Frankia nepalensis]MBL7524496.1 pyrroline-5-carboxylate reductase [Frankia nepalensis]MBL7631433.1 pyrroline-5-carboxylate reductase [Frankia nepalensis]
MTVAIIGAGRIGEALLAGLLKSGFDPAGIVVAEKDSARAAAVSTQHGVRATTPKDAAAGAELLVIAVKPQDMASLLAEIGPALEPAALVVSLAAGITLDFLQSHLPAGTPVVRVMPNTPLLVGEAMSALSAGGHVGEEQLERAEALLGSVGRVVRVPESQLDAATALSGSGPAYFFYLIDAMIEAGVLLGVPRALATELMVQTALGSARMLRESGEHPALLREAVTSPAGTTAAALAELDRRAVRGAILDALTAARDRSVELGRPR